MPFDAPIWVRSRRHALRVALSEAQNHRCAYCTRIMALTGWDCRDRFGGDLASIDHVVPRSKGGSDDWDNLVAACRRCNRLRGNMNAAKFAYLMRWALKGNFGRRLGRIYFIQRRRRVAQAAALASVVEESALAPLLLGGSSS